MNPVVSRAITQRLQHLPSLLPCAVGESWRKVRESWYFDKIKELEHMWAMADATAAELTRISIPDERD